GAAALATALDNLRPFLAQGRLTVVTASMADKDVDGVVAALSRSDALHGARVIATQLDVPRALPADELAARWTRVSEPGWSVSADSDPVGALDRAIAAADGPVVVAGSLYLVGLARGRLVDDPGLRDPEPERAGGRGAGGETRRGAEGGGASPAGGGRRPAGGRRRIGRCRDAVVRPPGGRRARDPDRASPVDD